MFIDFNFDFDQQKLRIKTRSPQNISIKWQTSPIFIKLPKLICQSVIKYSQLYQQYNVTLSFEDEDIDPTVKKCLTWLIKLEQYIKSLNIGQYKSKIQYYQQNYYKAQIDTGKTKELYTKSKIQTVN